MTEDLRRGDYISTFTGIKFWFLDPRPEEIVLEDIAHHLALQCRYCGGPVKEFYSVGEHSVRVALAVWRATTDPLVTFAALLHDASEAYIHDITSPLKRHLPDYKAIEGPLQRAINRRFGLAEDAHEHPAIKQADLAIAWSERRDISTIPEGHFWSARMGNADTALPETIVPWAWRTAEQQFLEVFRAMELLVGRDSP